MRNRLWDLWFEIRWLFSKDNKNSIPSRWDRWVKLHIVDDWPFGGLMVVALVMMMSSGAHAAELKASWYSRSDLVRDGQYKLTHFIMANGKEFFDNGRTCASWDYAIGTHLLVKNISNGKTVMVEVTDRTARRFKGKRIDLAKNSFAQIADCKQGIVLVNVKVIK